MVRETASEFHPFWLSSLLAFSFIPLATMLCRLINDAPASGAWNMAADESLLVSAADKDLCTLRFYFWETPTLSLGYFQEYADRERHRPSIQCSCVRRASGGGAIMHDKEITYSFSVPPALGWAKKHLTLYEAFHAVLIETLAAYGFSAELCRPAGSQRDRAQPFLCFERRAPGDVLVGENKVAGSAQRRYCSAVIQHGSILLDQSPCAPELLGLNDLGGKKITADDLQKTWMIRLAERLGLDFQPGELSDSERHYAAQLVEEKYGADRWNRHRGR
jgi:lipoate-protein ligase A